MSGRAVNNYDLGHSEQELARLEEQARLVEPITRSFFLEAGIAPGMRVLDVGSGAGDVALLAAELVGDAGEVVGVDRAAAALATARARAASRSLPNVSFVEGDLAEIAFERPFDAITGRYVLMFQPDPAGMLRSLARHVRPGGVIVFHEPDWHGARSSPPAPVYDEACRWLVESLRLREADGRMGAKLHGAFVAAGLPAPSMGVSALIGGGEKSVDCADLVAGLVTTLLPFIERLGIATAAQIGIETLAARIIEEATANASVLVGRSEIGAWARVSPKEPSRHDDGT